MRWIRIVAAFLLLLPFMAVRVRAFGGDVDPADGNADGSGGDTGTTVDTGGSDSGTYIDSGSSGSPGGRTTMSSSVFTSVLVLYFVVRMFTSRRNRSGDANASAQAAVEQSQKLDRELTAALQTKRIDEASLVLLQERDSGFSAATAEANVKYWVFMIEREWCAGDLTPCREYLTGQLFELYQLQLQRMRDNGERAKTEDLAVHACAVERWGVDGGDEFLDVWLHETKKTYMVAAHDESQVLKGSTQVTYHLFYRWRLVRPANSRDANWALSAVDKLAQVNDR